MSIDMQDKTGQIRDPKDFQEARRIITSRIIASAMPQDIELFVQYPIILDALRIAEAVASSALAKKT